MQHIKYMRLQSIKYTKKKTVGYKKSSSQKKFLWKKMLEKRVYYNNASIKTHKKEYNFKQQLQGCCLQ